MEEFWKGSPQVYTGNKGTVIRCIYKAKKIPAHEVQWNVKGNPSWQRDEFEIRLNICGVLQFIKDKVKYLDVNFIIQREKKWGYHRLNEKETYEFLKGE